MTTNGPSSDKKEQGTGEIGTELPLPTEDRIDQMAGGDPIFKNYIEGTVKEAVVITDETNIDLAEADTYDLLPQVLASTDVLKEEGETDEEYEARMREGLEAAAKDLVLLSIVEGNPGEPLPLQEADANKRDFLMDRVSEGEYLSNEDTERIAADVAGLSADLGKQSEDYLELEEDSEKRSEMQSKVSEIDQRGEQVIEQSQDIEGKLALLSVAIGEIPEDKSKRVDAVSEKILEIDEDDLRELMDAKAISEELGNKILALKAGSEDPSAENMNEVVQTFLGQMEMHNQAYKSQVKRELDLLIEDHGRALRTIESAKKTAIKKEEVLRQIEEAPESDEPVEPDQRL